MVLSKHMRTLDRPPTGEFQLGLDRPELADLNRSRSRTLRCYLSATV